MATEHTQLPDVLSQWSVTVPEIQFETLWLASTFDVRWEVN